MTNKIATIACFAIVTLAITANANAQKNGYYTPPKGSYFLPPTDKSTTTPVKAKPNTTTPVKTHNGTITSDAGYTVRGFWVTSAEHRKSVRIGSNGFIIKKYDGSFNVTRKRVGSWKTSPIKNRRFTMNLNYGNGETEMLEGILSPNGKMMKLTSLTYNQTFNLQRATPRSDR